MHQSRDRALERQADLPVHRGRFRCLQLQLDEGCLLVATIAAWLSTSVPS
jgi:hypothetical protein